MSFSESEKLVQFVQRLVTFEIYTKIDGNYDHIGATIADAVLQANNKYATNVKPRIVRIIAQYPEVRTTRALMILLQSIAVTEFLNWRGLDRAERFQFVLNLFVAEAIETQGDLREWLLIDANLTKLRSIKGIGPKTVDYFKILSGIQTNAIDRHLLKILELAGIQTTGYAHAQSIINDTADLLEVERAYFDHSIWQFMSKKTALIQVRDCVTTRLKQPN